MAPPAGLEPATYRVETYRSIQLSYEGVNSILRAQGAIIDSSRVAKIGQPFASPTLIGSIIAGKHLIAVAAQPGFLNVVPLHFVSNTTSAPVTFARSSMDCMRPSGMGA